MLNFIETFFWDITLPDAVNYLIFSTSPYTAEDLKS